MKKLIPMMAAVACAFGAFAESTGHKETFNDLPLGLLELNVDQGYWQGADGVEASVVEGREGKILDITDSSVTSPLYFNYNKVGSDGSGISKRQEIGDGVYLDTMVQFTVSSDLEQKDLGDDVKLAAWAYSNEDDEEAETKSTNLVIRAGYYDNGTLSAKTYMTDKEITADEWYRLTVKTIKIGEVDGQTYYGFVVYVNEKPVATDEAVATATKPIQFTATAKKYADEKQLFPSRVDGAGFNSIMGCGFAGTGKIDDVELTDVAPEFAKDDLALALTLSEGVASVVVKVGETVIPGTDNVYTLPAGTETVTIEATPEDGYMITSEGSCKADAGTFEVTAAKIAATVDGKDYTDLAEAIKAAAETGKMLVLAADVANEQIYLENGANLMLDLAGNNIGAVDGSATIYVDAGCALTITNSTEKIGVVYAAKAQSTIYVEGTVAIQGGQFEAGFEADAPTVVVTGGRFVAGALDNATVAEGYEAIEDGDYMVVQKKGEGPEPEPTYAVTINKADNTTVAEITSNDVVVATIATAKEGDVIKVTFAAAEDYEFEAEETGVRSVTVGTEAVTIDGPTATAIEYVTVAAPVTIDNGSYAVDPNGEKVRKGTTVTVTVTPDAEIEVESITINDEAITAVEGVYAKTFTANEDLEFTVVITKVTPPTPTRPTDIEGGSTEQQAAYDAWAKGKDLTGKTDAQIIDAFILDADVTATEAELKEIVAEEITTDMVADLASGKLTAGQTFTIADYPNATFKFVEVKDITTNAKLFKLTATFVPANAK